MACRRPKRGEHAPFETWLSLLILTGGTEKGPSFSYSHTPANVSSVFGFDDGFDHWDDGHAHGFNAFKNHGNLTTNRAIDWLDREARSMRFFLFFTPMRSTRRISRQRANPSSSRTASRPTTNQSSIEIHKGWPVHC
jgi:hypothetical protein